MKTIILLLLLALCFADLLSILETPQNLFSILQNGTNPRTCSNVIYNKENEKCDGVNTRCKYFLSCVDGICRPGQIGADCKKDTYFYFLYKRLLVVGGFGFGLVK